MRLDGQGLKCPTRYCAGKLIWILRKSLWFCQGCDNTHTRTAVQLVNHGRG